MFEEFQGGPYFSTRDSWKDASLSDSCTFGSCNFSSQSSVILYAMAINWLMVLSEEQRKGFIRLYVYLVILNGQPGIMYTLSL